MPIHREPTVERIITIALVVVLFGRRNVHRVVTVPGVCRADPRPGIVGTFSPPRGAVVLHKGVGIDWYLAVPVAPPSLLTDPAVVFSVLPASERSYAAARSWKASRDERPGWGSP